MLKTQICVTRPECVKFCDNTAFDNTVQKTGGQYSNLQAFGLIIINKDVA